MGEIVEVFTVLKKDDGDRRKPESSRAWKVSGACEHGALEQKRIPLRPTMAVSEMNRNVLGVEAACCAETRR